MVVIDKVSMITKTIFDLIINTLNKLPRRPVLILARDERQQPPLVTKMGKVRHGVTILLDGSLKYNCEHHRLIEQFRVEDSDYQSFLDLIGVSRLNSQQLERFQDN